MLPTMTRIRQGFPRQCLADVVAAMESALARLDLPARIRAGDTVGVPVGSRGIRHLPLLVRTVVDHLRRLGAHPVIIAAMGSHGGGTEHGQRTVLQSLGITTEAVGAPLLAGVEAVRLSATDTALPVYTDRLLLQCDSVVLLNRIKPHTSFRGRLESGLVKQLVVGCGKREGAELFHNLPATGLSDRLREIGTVLLGRLPVVGGVAVLENAYKEIAALEPLKAEEMIAGEELLLLRAKALLPQLPVRQLDVLVVEEMGKDIAGTGMDTNVIGRIGIRGVPDGEPLIERIVALNLSPGSHGNANGMGLADFTTRRFAKEIDFTATYLNTLTARFVDRAKLPIVLNSDREAIETAVRSLGHHREPSIIRIRSTSDLQTLWVSPSVLSGLIGPEVDGYAEPWEFDDDGTLR